MLFIHIKTYLTSFFASRDNTFDGPKSMGRDPYGPTSMIFEMYACSVPDPGVASKIIFSCWI